MFLHLNKKHFLAAAIILICSTAAFTQNLRWAKAAPFPEPDEELYGINSGTGLQVSDVGNRTEAQASAPTARAS